jgi:hypothetical protein
LGDAAGFLAWQAGRSKRIASKPTVALDVVRDNRRGMMLTRVSAAAVYRNGPPSVKYQWDWTSDGRIDVTTGLPWSSHNYSLKRGRFYATVTIRFADNTSIKRKLCIQRERRVDKAC